MDAEEVLEFRKLYDLLNEVLRSGGLPAHDEPLNYPQDELFEAQMWGYSGLHTVRRLAAFHALENRLPSQPGKLVEASKDAVLEQLYQAHNAYFQRRPRRGLFALLATRPRKPKFQHLLWHSDCEGFYVPQDFEDVLLDDAQPQRAGLGGMVGSSVRLLAECRELADLIGLPSDIDPEAEELWEAADTPVEGGPKWQTFGLESFCLARLIRGCELSLQHKAALVFT
jgi:hypothetical protein